MRGRKRERLLGAQFGIVRWALQGGQPMDVLALNAQQFPTRCDHAHLGRLLNDALGQVSHRPDDVFAAIKNKQ